VPIVLKFGSLNLLEPSGPVMGLLYLYLYIQGRTSIYEKEVNFSVLGSSEKV
jgi:hypothetical protein